MIHKGGNSFSKGVSVGIKTSLIKSSIMKEKLRTDLTNSKIEKKYEIFIFGGIILINKY